MDPPVASNKRCHLCQTSVNQLTNASVWLRRRSNNRLEYAVRPVLSASKYILGNVTRVLKARNLSLSQSRAGVKFGHHFSMSVAGVTKMKALERPLCSQEKPDEIEYSQKHVLEHDLEPQVVVAMEGGLETAQLASKVPHLMCFAWLVLLSWDAEGRPCTRAQMLPPLVDDLFHEGMASISSEASCRWQVQRTGVPEADQRRHNEDRLRKRLYCEQALTPAFLPFVNPESAFNLSYLHCTMA
eukprot:TRINITY_DN1617_c0_g1_i1.p1 TRINITY_DN1617_c0_g1~~TRINITY_DN1617_c0_g1_i1.p1  ORF type:complete len:242 (+),score=19.00 TRINITY_DN1617_c0_g1_i1:126-851(+)